MKEELEELANTRQIYNVEFVGYAPYGKMAAYLKQSDVLVNSFVKKAPQSIVTKIGDYLAAGKAMINTCMSPEFREKSGGRWIWSQYHAGGCKNPGRCH